MKDGFLGYQTSFMLDFVVCALIAVVPILLWSLYQVRFRRNYRQHRFLQLSLGSILLIAVLAFEVDLHLVQGGWAKVVAKRELTAEHLATIAQVLKVHLIFAITTPILWALTITFALRNFGSDPSPGSHSITHRRLGWASTIDLVLTSVTGLIFYYIAFVQ